MADEEKYDLKMSMDATEVGLTEGEDRRHMSMVGLSCLHRIYAILISDAMATFWVGRGEGGSGGRGG